MFKKFTNFALILLPLLLSGTLFAQNGPIPIVPATFVDSSVYNGIYKGTQTQFFCEPTTGNLIASWYTFYGSSAPDPRRITAATSTDGGQTWAIHENINFGVGTEMNARYGSVSGNATTPIIAYSDRNPGGTNQDSRPIVAYDILGWGGDLFDNLIVDNSGSADTVLYNRYISSSVAPDNGDLWAIGSYHSPAPGQSYYYYFSQDAGLNWTGPRVVMSEIAADSLNPNYVFDLSSRGLGVGLGNSNSVMASGAAKIIESDIWRVVYSISSDMGNTWSPVMAIPGTEALYCSDSDNYRNYTSPFLDGTGNWHIFAVAYDTTESDGSFPTPYYAYDYRFDGSIWNITKVAIPQLIPNGIAAWGDYPPDIEQRNFNEPAVAPDGTIYYVYSDVVDTTGAGGDVANFTFNMMVMYSEDNGDTWYGPVSILDNWHAIEPHGAARNATDKLHVIFKDDSTDLFYMGVPFDSIKTPNAIGSEIPTIMPDKYSLKQNYPNPFNPATTISFDLLKNSHVTLTVYNSLGQEIAVLVDDDMTAGYKGVVWDASGMPSGTYFYKIEAGDFTATKKMVLLK